MQFELYDDNKNERILTFNANILPFSIHILNVTIEKPFFHMLPNVNIDYSIDLQIFLENRCPNILHPDYDDWALDFLDLKENKCYFGRMNDSRILIGVLQRFRSNNDTYAVYPIYNECISMLSYDPIAYNVGYILTKRGELNGPKRDENPNAWEYQSSRSNYKL